MDDLAETVSRKRVSFMLRLPAGLAHDIKNEAWKRGISANTMATIFLRYAVTAANEKVTLTERLNIMGVK